MTFKTDGEKPLFNAMLVGSHNGKMLILSFNCPADSEGHWAELIENCFTRIKLHVEIDSSNPTPH